MMMEHIRQFDWCATSGPRNVFVEESALDNSNIEKILRNKFRHPLISSSDEDEPNVINWDAVYKKRIVKNKFVPKQFCPGLRAIPPYPKLSVLTGTQHYQCLKVICSKHPKVLEKQSLGKPTHMDKRCFEALTEIYQNEQKEYIEWAKSQWESQHCARALRPKPLIETTYEAEFNIRAQRLSGYSKNFDMAAQIPLECTRGHKYDIVRETTLIDVKISDIPEVELPQLLKNESIIRPGSVPEPCHKHPCQFILPNEHSISLLPLSEIHRELANFAAEHHTKYIASENALRCLMAFNRHWSIPITVCSAYSVDGENINVAVLDSEFSVYKEPAIMRTYKAYRHLLEYALIPSSELDKRLERYKKKQEHNTSNASAMNKSKNKPRIDPDSTDDDEPLGLYIMEEDIQDANKPKAAQQVNTTEISNMDADVTNDNEVITDGPISIDAINDIIGVYKCTCSDTMFEVPPDRSFSKWRITNQNKCESHNLIVHCPHKTRHQNTELVVEAIPEYQLELGGSELPPDRLRALLLSLMLRDNVFALNVRIDGMNGDIVTYDTIPAQQFLNEHKAKCQEIMNVIHTTLSELEGLLPGHYVLQHEPTHGKNAFLLVARPNGDKLELKFNSSQLLEDEAKMVKNPPTIAPVLLPYHKHRKILPCAFTPFENQLAKESKKPPVKQKAPPQAIKWPKKNKKKKKKKSN